MRILITGADCTLARAVMAALSDKTSIVAFDSRFTEPLLPGIERREGDPRDPNTAAGLLDGIETVLDLAPISSQSGDEMTALDEASRGTYVLMMAAIDAGVSRFIVGSTLDLFEQLPAEWEVNELWRPRPKPKVDQLRALLAELSARALARTWEGTTVCLRFGHVVADSQAASETFDPQWLHADDAVAGVERALAYEQRGWSVYHITAAGEEAKVRLGAAAMEPFSYHPTHDFRESARASASSSDKPPVHERSAADVLGVDPPVPSRPIRKVVIFGAGGPLGAVVAPELAGDYQLRLTDVRPLEQIAAEQSTRDPSTDVPAPVALGPPHECRVVDVTDPKQVVSACEGMDAVINCSVVRWDPADAFRVNTLGAYNVAGAAVENRIRRVVHTGPQMVSAYGEREYLADYEVSVEAPPRPGRTLYLHSKYLGQELCRVFAESYGLEIPALLFNNFVDPRIKRRRVLDPFVVSWQDAARAIRRALEVPGLPQPYEVLHIGADLPLDKYTNRKAKEVLSWQPQDDLRYMWSRRD